MIKLEQEPIAWFDKTLNGIKWQSDVRNCDLYDKQPLYLAPPERNPMTDEAIDDLYYIATNQSLRPQDKELAYSFARAIEAAHGIKE